MKKKILFVINTLGHAGAEMAMLELVRYLGAKDYEISLYVLMGQGELVHRLPTNVKLLNRQYSDASVLSQEGHRNMIKTIGKVALIRGNIMRLSPYMCANGLAMWKNKKFQPDKLLWRMLSDGAMRIGETYDLAIAYLEGGSAYYVANHVKAKKKVAFVHIDYELAGYTRKLDKDCYLNYNRIFTVSNEVKEHFLHVYPECTKYTNVFHNLINQEEIIKKSQEPGGFMDNYDGIRLLTVGRLTYQKGYDIAIAAMQQLKQKGYHLRWYILGEGPKRGELEAQIDDLGLQQDFILLGADANPYPYYAQTDIYVHATRFEGKSIAIQEAQTLGKAIIASDCSGNKEQIANEQDGILCKLTVDDLTESIITLMEHKDRIEQYGESAKKKDILHVEDLNMIIELLNNA